MSRNSVFGVTVAAVFGCFLNMSAVALGAFPPYDGKNFVPEVSGAKTGFFHAEKSPDGKWWVIDPLGRGFGVFGVDHVYMNGHYTWQSESCPQYKNNLRKFGSRPAWEQATIDRLVDWGFNMLGSGSETVLRHRGLVHTDFLSMGAGFCDYAADSQIVVYEHRPCSGFPNVFHPDFPKFCAERAVKVCTPQKDDPWLFGYFIDNELAWWGNGSFDDGLYLAAKALPATHSARQALDAYLKKAGAEKGEPSLAVKRGFTRLCAEKYFAITAAAIREVDPNHLVLGARFAGTGGPHVWAEAGKYCDVLTVNCYAVADLDANVIRYQGDTLKNVYEKYFAAAQKPMIVTEWSFPALDSGLPCTEGAGQRFRTQTGRTRATKLFAQTLLSLPFVVGYDYFMWTDEPATGISKFFPENTNYGLTDNDGEAYPEITAMFKDLQRNVYRERSRPTPAERAVAKKPAIGAATMMRALGIDPDATDGDRVVCTESNGVHVVSNAAGLVLSFSKEACPKIEVDGQRYGEIRHGSGATVGGQWQGGKNEEFAGFSFRNEGTLGVAEAKVRGGRGVATCLRFTVWPNRQEFLAEVVGFENGAEKPVPEQCAWFDVVSPFIDYSMPDSIAGLWRRPPYQSWFAADGKRLGVVSLSEHAGTMSFRHLRDGGYEGLADWKLPEPVMVEPGKAAKVDGFYALVVPGRGGRGAWRNFVASLKPSVDESGLDASPAGHDWPLVTMRQMSSTSFDAETMKKLVAIHAKHPKGCGETWLAEGYPPARTGMVARARALGDLAPRIRAAGMRVGFQQGVTLGHDFSQRDNADGEWPADAFTVDDDGKPTGYFCPTSPDVLAREEAYAETYVREGKLESFWLDDDLRLGFYKGRAASCWCPRCLKLLNAKAGTNLTREQFIARLDADVADEPLRAVWAEFKGECLAKFAAAARRGAKRANPAVRMGYQAISSASITCGFDYRPILAALSDDFRDTVGIRPGHGFYHEHGFRHELPTKLLGVAAEAERCRAIPGWKGCVCYEQENYPHYAVEKTAEFCVKECALALAAGCDAVSQYWYSSDHPEPLDHYEDVVRTTAAWQPYLARLAEVAVRTHLGGVAHKIDPKLMTSKANTVAAALQSGSPRHDDGDVTLMRLSVPVTVEASGTKSFYDPKRVASRFNSDWSCATTSERAEILDELDRLGGGPLPVRVEKVHPLWVFARVDDGNRTVAVTFFNASFGTAMGVPVRIRRPAGVRAAVVRPCADDEPLALEDGADGEDEVVFTLPDLAPGGVMTVLFPAARRNEKGA